ncbi:MAG: chemotaxis protein CheA, partial [Gemmatimonadaceae bacterium]
MDLARYADLFRTESREHLAEIDAALLALEKDGDIAGVTVLFRSTHTIKGMAASMGYRAVEQISHALETLLDAMRSGARGVDANVIALLFDGSDALAQAVEDAVAGRSESSNNVDALVQRLASAVEPITKRSGREPNRRPSGTHRAIASDSNESIFPDANVEKPSAPALAASLPQELQRLDTTGSTPDRTLASPVKNIEVKLSPDAALKGVRALIVLAKLEALGSVRSMEPAQHTWNDDRFDGTMNLALETAADDAKIEAGIRSAGDVARVTIKSNATRRVERETLRHVRIDLRRLDTLLDLVGELVITRDRLIRAADMLPEASGIRGNGEGGSADRTNPGRGLASVVHDTARLVSALQEEVLRTRMVPVGQVFDRFPRLVRDLARDLGKEVTFVMEGREIELDRSLLDAIGDPIVHLLRNAIDHGVETAEARRNKSKTGSGKLVLRAARDRAAVLVQVEDDGGGIDRDAVLARAKAEGIVDADITSLTDEGLLKVLSRAGFSTAAAVTAVSGRGVGIDVVASRVRALGGALEMTSVRGQGTTFTLRLPVTLAIVRALLVRVGNETYALPSAHVLEALEYEADSLLSLRGQETVTLRDDVIPLLRLRPRFGLPSIDDEGTHLVLVEASGRRTALQVDSLIGQQDVVVKPYDAVQDAENLFTGATILGDGTPALIVDL